MQRATIAGVRGMVATVNHRAGDIINKCIQTEIMQEINHSCSPTATIQRGNIVAMSTIYIGDEITLDFINHPESVQLAYCHTCDSIVKGDTSLCNFVNIV